jgi:hypothetical protein
MFITNFIVKARRLSIQLFRKDLMNVMLTLEECLVQVIVMTSPSPPSSDPIGSIVTGY